jgi:hypothetical protein
MIGNETSPGVLIAHAEAFGDVWTLSCNIVLLWAYACSCDADECRIILRRIAGGRVGMKMRR